MIHNTVVEDNVAKDYNFSRDESSGYGGGFFIKISGNNLDVGILNITDSAAKRNTGNRGGGFLRVEAENEAMLNIHIKNSTFTENQAQSGYGGAISLHWKTQAVHQSENPQYFTVTGCIFELNLADKGGAVSIKKGRSECDIKFLETTFHRNTGSIWGGALFIKYESVGDNINPFAIEVRFDRVNMVENKIKNPRGREGAGGAVYISFYPPYCFFSVAVMDSNVLNNSAPNSGGGFCIILRPFKAKTSILRSNFSRNFAEHGGAMKFYLAEERSSENEENDGPISLDISSCTFTNNLAGYGGAIYQSHNNEFNESILGFINVTETTFLCCDKDLKFDVRNGTFIFSKLIAHLNEISIWENSDAEERSCSVPSLMIENYAGAMSIVSVYYFCAAARVVYEYNRKLLTDRYTYGSFLNGRKVDELYSVNLGCGNCQELPYRLGDGSVTLSKAKVYETDENHYVQNLSGLYTLKDYPCRVCPFGGKCYLGKIYARPNYWGHKDKNDILNFQSCPRGYCCDDVHTQCQRYDTCSPHRTGKLCGECEEGYSESLMSVTCVANDKCNDWWIWPLGFLLAASYLLWYMYKGKLIPFTRGFIEKLLSFRSYTVNSAKSIISVTKQQNQSENNVDKGYFDIMVYFVNIISLLKIKVEFQSGSDESGFLYDIEKYFTRYLDVDVQQVANITICPFEGVTAVTKNLARPIFVLMILIIWSSLFSLTVLLRVMFQRRKSTLMHRLSAFKLTLIEGYVETMKYSYSGLAGVTFLFLSCIPIRDNMVWKFNAEVMCLSSWQIWVITVAVIYTVPFSFTTILGLKLLRWGKIGHYQFMIGSLCPLPFLMYWSVVYVITKVQQQKIKSEELSQVGDRKTISISH